MLLRACLLALLATPCGLSTAASDLPQSGGKVLLTVTGAIVPDAEPAQQETGIAFDLAMLRDTGVAQFQTTTIWTDGLQTFEGVPLDALMQRLGVTEGTLRASAVNDYAIEIPVSDAVPDGPILAWARNGELMSLRDKGPLWIVYPYDTDAAYQSEVIYARSIWQLDRIEVLRP